MAAPTSAPTAQPTEPTKPSWRTMATACRAAGCEGVRGAHVKSTQQRPCAVRAQRLRVAWQPDSGRGLQTACPRLRPDGQQPIKSQPAPLAQHFGTTARGEAGWARLQAGNAAGMPTVGFAEPETCRQLSGNDKGGCRGRLQPEAGCQLSDAPLACPPRPAASAAPSAGPGCWRRW